MNNRITKYVKRYINNINKIMPDIKNIIECEIEGKTFDCITNMHSAIKFNQALNNDDKLPKKRTSLSDPLAMKFIEFRKNVYMGTGLPVPSLKNLRSDIKLAKEKRKELKLDKNMSLGLFKEGRIYFNDTCLQKTILAEVVEILGSDTLIYTDKKDKNKHVYAKSNIGEAIICSFYQAY